MFFHQYSNTMEVGWQFWRLSSPVNCPKQGQLEQVILYHVQLASISAWMENFTASMGNLCQCWNNLTRKRKFLYLNGISCFSLSPLPLVLSMDNKEKSLNSFFSYPPFKFYTGKVPTYPSFLQAKYFHIPQLILLGELFQAINNVGGTF